MEIKSGIKYYIKAIAKRMIIFPRGKYFNLGEVVEGNLDGKTLKLLEYALDIQEIKEIKEVQTKPTEPKVEAEPIKENTPKSRQKKIKED